MLSNLSLCVSIYKSNIQQSMPSNVHCKDHQQSIAALRGLPSSLRLVAIGIDSQNPITYFSLSTCTLEVTVVICMFTMDKFGMNTGYGFPTVLLVIS